MNSTRPGSRLRARLITAAVVIVLLAAVIAQLPRGFSDDMTKIGRGSNVVVLVHNKNGLQSQEVMEVLNRIRPDYAPGIEFLVADVDAENGKAFMRAQQVDGVALVFFGPDGTRHGVLSGSADEREIRTALDSTYGRIR